MVFNTKLKSNENITIEDENGKGKKRGGSRGHLDWWLKWSLSVIVVAAISSTSINWFKGDWGRYPVPYLIFFLNDCFLLFPWMAYISSI